MLGLPIMAGLVGQMLMGVADTVMVGLALGWRFHQLTRLKSTCTGSDV